MNSFAKDSDPEKGSSIEAATSKRVPATMDDAVPIHVEISLSGLHILIVDDDYDARNYISLALEHYGARVTKADSAAEVLRVIDKIKPDVLVSDIEMPGQDGYELIRKVRGRWGSPTKNIPALALTAHHEIEEFHKALEAGFQMHISKPIEVTYLAAAVADLVELSKRTS